MKSWLALGDSYTIGESVPERDRYAIQATGMLKDKGISFEEPVFVAKTGWTTKDLLTAIKDRNLARYFDLVTLLIGVNNQYQGKTAEEYAKEFSELLQLSIGFSGGNPSHVIVLSIPDYSVTPFSRDLNQSGISRQIDAFNAINRKITAKHVVQYLDITEGSRKAAHDPELIAEDGLHFSGKEYERWAIPLAKMIEKIFA